MLIQTILQVPTSETLTIVERLGLIGLLLLILIGGSRGWWVFGRTYLALERDRDLYRDIALRGTAAAEKASNAVASLAEDGVKDRRRLEEMSRVVDDARRRGLIG